MSSDKKITANRRNAAKSTGPSTEAGKRNSKNNALKTGIYVRELFVHEDEQPEFDTLCESLHYQFKPETEMRKIAFERSSVVAGE